MTPTMTREIMLSLMDHMRQGMAAYLIYMPELGMGALSPQQYQRRYMFTMREAVSYELGVNPTAGALSLNGYSRYVTVYIASTLDRNKKKRKRGISLTSSRINRTKVLNL